MNWIIAGALVFISSVVMYLLIRKCNLLKIPIIFQNLVMFIIPLVFYLIFAKATYTSVIVTPYELIVLVITSIICSYIGNMLSLKSIEYAPNPGYSLIIQKSYVVFTTIIALIFLQGELTIRTGIGILLIVGCSALVMIGKPKTDQSHVRKSWLPYAIGAFFCFGMLAIMSKYLLDLGVPVYTRLIYLAATVSGFILLEMIIKKQKKYYPTKKELLVLVAVGMLSGSFNYFMQVGYALAPNIGYINAINAASISGISLVSSFLFKDELNKKKFLGIIGVTIGLILLVL